MWCQDKNLKEPHRHILLVIFGGTVKGGISASEFTNNFFKKVAMQYHILNLLRCIGLTALNMLLQALRSCLSILNFRDRMSRHRGVGGINKLVKPIIHQPVTPWASLSCLTEASNLRLLLAEASPFILTLSLSSLRLLMEVVTGGVVNDKTNTLTNSMWWSA